MSSFFHVSRAFFNGVFLLWMLSACSPQYNWRTVPNNDVGYTATFPDKPAKVTRTVHMIGLQVPLTLHAAQVDGFYFAVGTVPLQRGLQGKSTELRDALALAVSNNIAAAKPDLRQIQWLGKPGQEMLIKGQLPNGQHAVAHARFFEHRGTFYEVLLIGQGEQISPDVLTTWLSGFSLLEW